MADPSENTGQWEETNPVFRAAGSHADDDTEFGPHYNPTEDETAALVGDGVKPSHAVPPYAQTRREILPLWVIIAYAAPNVAGAALFIPVAVHLNKFYTDTLLVPPSHLAFAIAVARAFDLLVDPFVGWVSDNTNTSWGRRRPFIAIGAPIVAVTYVLLFSPPKGLSPPAATVWFTCFFAVYLMVPLSLPHHSLGPELTLDYHERSRLFAWTEAFTVAGTILGSLGPAVTKVWFGSERAGFFWMAIFNAILLILLYELLVLVLRERPDFKAGNPIIPGMRRTMRNRPFVILLAVYVVDSVTAYSVGTLLPFFVSYVLAPKNESFWLSVFLVVFFGTHLFAIPFWLWLARRKTWGKKNAWLLGWTLAMPAQFCVIFLGKGDHLIYLGLLAWIGFCGGASFLNWAIKADVIDYDEFHTGKRREGQYLAFWELVPKLMAIPGASVPFAILGAVGYKPDQPQTPEVILAIRLLTVFMPCFFGALALSIAFFFPITEKIHHDIIKGIDQHNAGQPAFDSLTKKWIRPPQASAAVEEETSWLLDYFSARELEAVIARGTAKGIVRSITIDMCLCILGFIVSLALLLWVTIRNIDSLWAVPCLVVTSVFFAFVVYHFMRLKEGRVMEQDHVPMHTVQAHLDERIGYDSSHDQGIDEPAPKDL